MITLTAEIHLPNGEKIIINNRNLISLSRNIDSQSDLGMVSYGIISSNGSITFNDIDRKILSYADNLLLKKGLNTKIFLNDTLTKKTEQIGDYLTENWNYDSNSYEVSVSLLDGLEEWQDIYTAGVKYDALNNQPKTLEYFYKYLHGKTPERYKMVDYSRLDEITEARLKSISIVHPFLDNASLWQQWDKICKVGGLYIYKNGKGETICKYRNGS